MQPKPWLANRRRLLGTALAVLLPTLAASCVLTPPDFKDPPTQDQDPSDVGYPYPQPVENNGDGNSPAIESNGPADLDRAWLPFTQQGQDSTDSVPPETAELRPSSVLTPLAETPGGIGFPGGATDGASVGQSCQGTAARSGATLTVDGQPFVFFGVNAHYLVDKEFDESHVDALLGDLHERGINTVRLFYFWYHDPDRFERLLDAGRRHGIRFVVALADDVFKGVDWFINDGEQRRYGKHLDETLVRFKDRPEVLIWELVNEPNCGEGRYDDECLKTIRGWLAEQADRINAVDRCHLVSTGMIGAGNFENEEKSFRTVNRKQGIDIVSVHRRDADKTGKELEFANDDERPIYYGEIYDEAYDEGCQPLEGERSPSSRAERVKDDLRQAVEDGVDGYLLWDLTAYGFCSKFGYELDDPLWGKLQRSEVLPKAPW